MLDGSDWTLSPEEFADFISERRWQTAKTMPHNPHQYTVVKWHVDVAKFYAAVRCIRRYGRPYVFGKKTYTVLDSGPHRYWTMGAPLPDTILINRALNE